MPGPVQKKPRIKTSLFSNYNNYKNKSNNIRDGSALSFIQYGNLFQKSEKNEFLKVFFSSIFNFFSSTVALAVSILTTNNLQANRLCCQQNFIKVKLYIWALPLIKLLRYWQQCITSFSIIPFKRTLLAISKVSSWHPGVRWTKIALSRVLSLLRHHSKLTGNRGEYCTAGK